MADEAHTKHENRKENRANTCGYISTIDEEHEEGDDDDDSIDDDDDPMD